MMVEVCYHQQPLLFYIYESIFHLMLFVLKTVIDLVLNLKIIDDYDDDGIDSNDNIHDDDDEDE